jgi:hypothetical protein
MSINNAKLLVHFQEKPYLFPTAALKSMKIGFGLRV